MERGEKSIDRVKVWRRLYWSAVILGGLLTLAYIGLQR